ncbi:MAG: exodeoxyribonuclease VII large subunit [Desulfobacterales bacterium]
MPDPFDDDTGDLCAQENAAADTARRVLTVSELTARIKSLLEKNFPFVWICGEISNLRIPGSGHLYFTLKDESAQVAAVMFRNQNRQLKFRPEDGMSVIGLGRISLYEPRGSYQIILEYLEPAGIGALQVAFEKLKRRLADAGYFDDRHKKPLPFLPRKIGIVTSATGAVVHDIITVTGRRFPGIELEIVPVRVQGPGAEDDICAAIALLNRRGDADVIILARGGGSLEDLQAFNSERVAMAIFNSAIPMVSAVGHETDFTIADFIADVRAPTPSAAAEIIAPDRIELLRRISDINLKIHYLIYNQLIYNQNLINSFRGRLRDPRRRIQELWIRIDDLQGRLGRLSVNYLKRKKDHLAAITRRVRSGFPATRIEKLMLEVGGNQYKIRRSIERILEGRRSSLRESKGKLESLNPLGILRRGYSVTRRLPDRRVVTDPDQVSLDQTLEVLVSEGTILCNVKGTERHGKKEL